MTLLRRFLDAARERIAAAAMLAVIALAAAVAIGRLSGPGAPFETDLLALLPNRLSEAMPEDLEARFKANLAASGAGRIAAVLEFEPLRGQTPAELDRVAAPIAEGFAKALLSARSEKDPEAGPLFLRDDSAEKAARAGLPVIRNAAGHLADPTSLEALEKGVAAYDAAMAKAKAAPDGLRAASAEAARQPLRAQMLACLMSASMPKILGFSADPFCLYDRWLFAKLRDLPVDAAGAPAGGEAPLAVKLRPESGQNESGAAWLASLSARPGAAESGRGDLSRAVAAASSLARTAAQSAGLRLSIAAAGVPLFTDAIAERASSELAMIGIISTVGVLIFAAALFGRAATVFFMALTVALGFLCALGASLAVFGKLSLVTFVFGATLIGVSIDYSSHWFALKRPGEGPFERRARMLPALLLAAGSTAAAYGVLGLTPLPGLKQMALLAAAGVLATLCCVLALLPFAEWAAPKRDARLMAALERTLPKIPRLDRAALKKRTVQLVLAVVLGAVAGGLSQLRFASGIRDLQGAPQALVAAQAEVGRRLGLPSPAQAYVVQGATLDEALEREMALRARIAADPALAAIRPSGLADWLPTAAEQAKAEALVRRAIGIITPDAEALLGATPKGPAPQAADARVTLEALLASPFGPLVRPHALADEPGRAAILVMLAGATPEALPHLAKAAKGLEGAAFVDLTASMNDTLSRYRDLVFAFTGIGALLLWGLLALRFGRESWRAVLPAAFGIAAALGFFGWAGLPATLFAALAGVLLLGLGVDYGIFLCSSPDDGRTSAAILFSGVTTMLSFGLLALSSTPALSAFGLMVLFGQSAIWIASPLLRPKHPAASRTAALQTNPPAGEQEPLAR